MASVWRSGTFSVPVTLTRAVSKRCGFAAQLLRSSAPLLVSAWYAVVSCSPPSRMTSRVLVVLAAPCCRRSFLECSSTMTRSVLHKPALVGDAFYLLLHDWVSGRRHLALRITDLAIGAAILCELFLAGLLTVRVRHGYEAVVALPERYPVFNAISTRAAA